MTLFSWLFIIAGGAIQTKDDDGNEKYESVNPFVYFFFEIFTNSLGDISIIKTQYWTDATRTKEYPYLSELFIYYI